VAAKETQLFCAQCNRFSLARRAGSQEPWRCTNCGSDAVTKTQPPRWRLAWGGHATDPIAPSEIRRWQRENRVPPDAQAQPEAGGDWVPLTQLKLPIDERAVAKRGCLGCAGVVALILVVFGVYNAVRKPTLAELDEAVKKREVADLERTREEARSKRVAQELKKNWVCKVVIPDVDMPYIPLFPSEDDVTTGVQAYTSMKGEPGDLARFVKNTGAIMVAKGTSCAWMDLGVFGPTQVRVLEGPYAGRAAWGPTNWVRVEE